MYMVSQKLYLRTVLTWYTHTARTLDRLNLMKYLVRARYTLAIFPMGG